MGPHSRTLKLMTATPIHTQDITPEALQTAKYLAEFAVRPMFRTPVHKLPTDRGLNDYEDIYFPSADCVPLEGWLIRARGSRKLIIINHPMPMSHGALG